MTILAESDPSRFMIGWWILMDSVDFWDVILGSGWWIFFFFFGDDSMIPGLELILDKLEF